jgi:hypothetical protein
MTDFAAVFIRYNALISLGFVNPWVREKLSYSARIKELLPMETASVDTNYDPCIREESVVSFKQFDIFITRLCHLCKRTYTEMTRCLGIVTRTLTATSWHFPGFSAEAFWLRLSAVITRGHCGLTWCSLKYLSGVRGWGIINRTPHVSGPLPSPRPFRFLHCSLSGDSLYSINDISPK